MKNRSLIIIIMSILYELILFFFRDLFGSTINLLNTCFWFITAVFAYLIIGTLKYKRRTKIDSIQLIIIVNLLYLFLSYIIGLFKGFERSNFDILLVIYQIISIVSMELTRYSLIKNTSSKYRYLVSFLFVIPLIIMFNLSFNMIFPILITSIMVTYIMSNVGFEPGMIYILLINLFNLISIRPRMDFVFTLIIILIVNIILFVLLNNLYKKDLANLNFIRKKSSKVIYLILIIIIPYIFLIIGFGNYKLIGIMSPSMEPTFSRGAGVIMRKIDGDYYDSLNVGDILVYEKDNKYIVHRIIKKVNGLLITKGDNSEVDDEAVTKEQYRGIVKLAIPLIGYPNVWLSE